MSRGLFVVERNFFDLCMDQVIHSTAQNIAIANNMLIGEHVFAATGRQLAFGMHMYVQIGIIAT